MGKKMPEENKKDTLKGLRIQTMSIWLVSCTILASILIGAGIINVMEHYQNLIHITNEYILTQKDVINMSLGSDYLTEQARLYAITRDESYAEAYFMEADVSKRRDKALQEMAGHLKQNDPVSIQLLSDALDLSNRLMDLEIHAMKLAALSEDADIGSLPQKLEDYPLPDEEQGYTTHEKIETAFQLVFGQEYRETKQEIENKLSEVTENVISLCSENQAASQAIMKKTLIWQVFYTVLIVLLVIVAYMMIAILILRPIRIYINCIKNNNILEITGAYEFKYLAITYNNIYEMTVAKENLLRQKAENDALTSLLNRQAFEQTKKQLYNTDRPIALLLIDVDIFKSINDTYGHDVGDQALVKTASLLKDNFRSADHVFRFGGDEFAVIMERTQQDKTEIIREKIRKINEVLLHPNNNFPKYSISVGVAFSENGYQDELFLNADRALYHTKENGRCGCSFFQPQA